jgi:plasmid stability protein
MSTPLQIRAVPDDILDALRAKAAREHISLAAYALRVLERDARMAVVTDVLTPPRTPSAISRKQIVKAVRAIRAGH